ncbi:sensory box/GGDEF family protein [Bacillus mycoides]|nr:sensory box/GGDEF family protein [Bacillus mycoides]
MKVVAEGVETKEQLEVLQNNACYLIQGYYYSKPVNEDELIKYVSTM